MTHGLAGAALAWALPESSSRDLSLHRAGIWAGFATAMFPDADVLLSPFSPDFYITQHRGLTHSFFLLPLWALILGSVAYALFRLRRAPPPPRALARFVAVSFIGVLSHILLDWITSWGTMFFSPISWDRYALDWVFIIDFPFSGLLVIGLAGSCLISRRSRNRGRIAARATCAAASLYIALCAVRHHDALEAGKRIHPEVTSPRVAIPQPFSPDRWLVLFDEGESVIATFIDLGKRGRDSHRSPTQQELESVSPSAGGIRRLIGKLDGVYRSRDDLEPRVLPKYDGPLARKALLTGSGGIFGRFARFPAARETRLSDGTTLVLLRDVRFGFLSAAIDPFSYRVVYDAAGRLVSSGFPSERWRQNGTAPGPSSR